ncbi:hypothetical protein BDQ94DRAFT_178699 [Aspergillus welwitschiae]|uniref:Uncharacterized protein n=1 Tax=Aspergillus welwitschiae TaxID=1341132 RepID=A0A3F3PH48_9EURO|nr:hypothetical protein BDQ94DRAFT_178699 [Aspergillus welwitschiae]RDH26270.1 hypothetical protein BDQ94DRAFT_178699 [Aspergillus welwitschiae]
MHLDHKIPWNTAATHLNIIRYNPRFTPRRTDFFARNKPSESSDLNYFRRMLISIIREFSSTEASKPLLSIPLDNLLSDNILSYPEQQLGLGPHAKNSALHNPLSSKHRDINYWIDSASSSSSTEPLPYSSADGSLADAVKMLIIIAANTVSTQISREAVSVLLILSRHPQVPLHTLANIHWGHAFGVEMIVNPALTVYIFINLMDAVLSDEQLKGDNGNIISLLETQSFQDWARDSLANYDYPAQNIPHRRYWNELGVTDEWAAQQRCYEGLWLPTESLGIIDPLKGEAKDIQLSLREYLKSCFAILYIYDMLLKEWYGEEEADAKWEYWIGYIFESRGCKL